MRIVDELGEEMIYWPVSGLKGGELSGILVVGIEGVPAEGQLTASPDDRLRVLARTHGTGDPFMDIVTLPIELSGLPAGTAWFDVVLAADADLEGAPRVALTLAAQSRNPAAWRA